MRLLLATLASCLIVACSAKPAAPAPEDHVAGANDEPAATGEGMGVSSSEQKTIEDMRAESLAAIDKTACAAAGGVVRQEGMLGMYRCVKPFADAGKACRSKSDCEGKCLATDDAAPDAEVVGVCQADDSPFGCYAEIEDGKIQPAICVD